MNILVVGSGGREHALTWKIAQSPLVENLYCVPGNPGMAGLATCAGIGVNEFDKLLQFAKDHSVDLTVVGPEDPLSKGIVDRFKESGLKAFGPSADAAQLEASKAFAKRLMRDNGIPTAGYAEFDDPEAAVAYVKDKGAPIVVKADGLAAGKGVTVAADVEAAVQAIREAMVDKAFGDAGNSVVIEECLVGEEASILALTDGTALVSLAPSQDHKPAYDGGKGPNTGGMGAYSPAPVVTDAMMREIDETVLRPCVEGMSKEGKPYAGVLYAGLMITETGPKVIEFNCRFGDPETQVVLPRMKSDLVPLLLACCDGTLGQGALVTGDTACVTVVMASGEYPRAYEKGVPITGIEDAETEEGVIVFHAGTKRTGPDLVTNGGRVLNVTASAPDISSAIGKAYRAVGKIVFEKAHWRTDIGKKALDRLG